MLNKGPSIQLIDLHGAHYLERLRNELSSFAIREMAQECLGFGIYYNFTTLGIFDICGVDIVGHILPDKSGTSSKSWILACI